MSDALYGYKCEYGEETVQEKIVAQEAFKHRLGFVILENAPIGVCDHCSSRYYHASLLHRVEEIAAKQKPLKKMEAVPVAAFV